MAGCSRILEYSSSLISDVRIRARSEEASGENSGMVKDWSGFVLLEPQTVRFAAGQPWSLRKKNMAREMLLEVALWTH